MTTLQQAVLQLEMDYAGHPYYVSGNALLHALLATMDDDDALKHRDLNVSHGMFVPQNFGKYPEWHSQAGTSPGFGSSLKPVEDYRDLFLFRVQQQPWLLDSRPRDALNTPDVKQQSGHPLLSRESNIGQRHSWCIHFYLYGDRVPLSEDTLDGLQVGGKRNYGYGTTTVADTQTVELSDVSFAAVRDADSHLLQLITPYVLASEYPSATDRDVPWWWDRSHPLRRRKEIIVEQREQYTLETIDHGQVVGYAGDDPVETARNGILRTGTHSKYGYGEFVVLPLDD